jgi:manganese/zinc/iron transport system permease protein
MIGLSVTGNVMLGTALLGATAGVIGSFAVLRRRALVGDMLSHAALPGICIAFLVMGSRNFLGLSLGALVSGLLGIGIVTLVCRWTRTKEDAAIGIVLSTFFGAGMVLMSVIQNAETSGNKAGLDRYLLGEVAGMSARDIQMVAAAALLCLFVVTFFYKEFQLLSFDQDFSAAQGWPNFALDLAMMSTLAIVTIVGLPICGVILMAAMVILPGAAARFWTNRLGRMLWIAGAVGAAAGVVGTFVASPLPQRWLGSEWLGGGQLPPGPLIVLSAATIFLGSLLFAPQHGVLARAIGEWRLQRRIVREHLLRALYELSEPQLPERPKLSAAKLAAVRGWNSWIVSTWLRRLQAAGLIDREGEWVRLTAAGLSSAAEVTRTHRLWELYLVESAGIAPDHVDRDADDVEHVLPAPLIRELEVRLTASERMPAATPTVPQSPHEVL